MNSLEQYKDKLAADKGFPNWKAYKDSRCGCESVKLEKMAEGLYAKLKQAKNNKPIKK